MVKTASKGNTKTKSKDWKQENANIFFIGRKEVPGFSFPLLEGKIIKDNLDGTFTVRVFCKTKGAPANPMTLSIESNRLCRGKS